ncbi:MAG TPA: hypothetical protein VNX00_14155, partial [Herbaspirillum sp.]|nr:hypothetical protein [Herbaspirillum sp.]
MQDPTVLGASDTLEQMTHDDRPNDRRRRFCVALGCLGFGAELGAPSAFAASPTRSPMADKTAEWSEVQQIVAAASRPGLEWRGPTAGPKAARNKTIALWADNLRNGGVLGAA